MQDRITNGALGEPDAISHRRSHLVSGASRATRSRGVDPVLGTQFPVGSAVHDGDVRNAMCCMDGSAVNGSRHWYRFTHPGSVDGRSPRPFQLRRS